MGMIKGKDFCCGTFEKMVPAFGWYFTDDNVYLMPYILNTEPKLRVNHCPCCGAEVRNVKIKKDYFIELN